MDARAIRDALEPVLRGLRPTVVEAFSRPRREVHRKLDGTVVTSLDRELERRITDALLDLDPHWGVTAEESGRIRDGRPTWFLDALDGSLNFARRLPLFVSQAVLMDGEQPLFAVLYEPLRDQFAWAAHGEGAWREGQRLHVARRPIEDALLLVDIARTGAFVTHSEMIPRLRRSVYRMRSFGCVGLNFLEVATGAADAFLGTRRTPSPLHDVGPGVLFVREAGGVATNLRGTDAILDRRSFLVAHHELHQAIRRVVLSDETV